MIVIAPAAGVRRPWLPVEHSGRRFAVCDCDGDCDGACFLRLRSVTVRACCGL